MGNQQRQGDGENVHNLSLRVWCLLCMLGGNNRLVECLVEMTKKGVCVCVFN